MGKQVKTADNLLSYTEAARLTGLSVWQLQYAVRMGRIETEPIRPRTGLVKDSLLEFAGQK